MRLKNCLTSQYGKSPLASLFKLVQSKVDKFVRKD